MVLDVSSATLKVPTIGMCDKKEVIAEKGAKRKSWGANMDLHR